MCCWYPMKTHPLTPKLHRQALRLDNVFSQILTRSRKIDISWILVFRLKWLAPISLSNAIWAFQKYLISFQTYFSYSKGKWNHTFHLTFIEYPATCSVGCFLPFFCDFFLIAWLVHLANFFFTGFFSLTSFSSLWGYLCWSLLPWLSLLLPTGHRELKFVYTLDLLQSTLYVIIIS